MTRKYFGTDGIRGRVGEMPITPEFVMHLGYSAGKVLTSSELASIKRRTPGGIDRQGHSHIGVYA